MLLIKFFARHCFHMKNTLSFWKCCIMNPEVNRMTELTAYYKNLKRLKNTLPFMPQYSVDMVETYPDDEVEQGFDGNWYEKGHAPQKPLEEARAAKLAELNTAFTSASETAHCMSSAGFEINADETANRNIEGLVLVVTEGESTLFRAYDNSFHEVTKEQLETMRKEIVVNSQRLYQTKWQIEAAIEAAETVDELDTISISFDTLVQKD